MTITITGPIFPHAYIVPGYELSSPLPLIPPQIVVPQYNDQAMLSAEPTPPKRSRRKGTNTTYVTIIADESGSMAHLQDEVISGMNRYLADRQAEAADGHDIKVTILTFDTTCTTVADTVGVAQQREMTREDYGPCGMTALYDAIVQAIEMTNGKLGKSDRALVCIITDGDENASRRVRTKEGIRRWIDAKTAERNWTFTYLSADLNAFRNADAIGITAGNTSQFVPTMDGAFAAFNNVSASSGTYMRSGMQQSVGFYAGDQPKDPQ